MARSGGRDLVGQRKKAASQVHARYAKFGEQVVTLMMQFAIRPNGLQEAAKKLQIPFKSDKEAHLHDLISRFIHDCGVATFLQYIAPKSAAAQASALAQAQNQAQNVTHDPAQTPGQITLDRRSGIERRQRVNRRKDIEVITLNTRFGGDRRSGVDRRQKNLSPPWPDTDGS